MNLDNTTYFSSDEECYELSSAWKIAAKKNIESKKFYYVPSEKELYECRVIGYSEYLTIQVLIIEVISKQFLDLTLCNSANGGKACIYGLFRHLLYGRTIRI